MTDIIFQSALSIARALRKKEVSSVEVTTAYIDRIEQVNHKLNAVVMLDESVMDQARAADVAMEKGEVKGALHGVPMTLKDSHDTEGVVTTGGTKGRSNFIPSVDSTITSRLKESGAVLLGKTNTPELTMGIETENLVYGRTSNPYDHERTCGGSSGGAAAIVAAGGSPFDIGSDTGGSIRFPAHCCGVTGIKPTSGRVPRTGHIIPHGMGVRDSLTQIGPIARYVEDLALILPIISGPDWRDPAIVPMPLHHAEDVDVSSLRVAFYTDNGIKAATPETVAIVNSASAVLEDVGATIEEARPRAITEYDIAWQSIPNVDDSINRRLEVEGTIDPHPWTTAAIEYGNSMTVAEFGSLLEEIDAFRSDILGFMKDYDVLLSPTMPTPALPHGEIRSERLVHGSYTRPHNVTGWPATVVRGGTSPEGMPIGIQIVARPWREDVAIAVAMVIESSLGGWKSPNI